MVCQGNELFTGVWVEPAAGDTIGLMSPFTEQVLAGPAGLRANVDRAVRAA